MTAGREGDDDQRQHAIELVRAVAVAVNSLGHGFAKKHNLHRTDADALVMIMDAGREGTDIGPSQLARRLRITTASVTVLIDRLVEAGHVRRTPDPTDRRRLVLRITESAMIAGRGFFGAVNADLLDATADFTAADLATVTRFLTTVQNTVVDHDGASVKA